MADVKTILSGNNKLVISITGKYPGGDENSIIVDSSSLIGPDGINPPTKICIDELTWTVGAAYEYIELEWRGGIGSSGAIGSFHGQGYIDYSVYGGLVPPLPTGKDVRLRSKGGDADASYTILMHCTLKN